MNNYISKRAYYFSLTKGVEVSWRSEENVSVVNLICNDIAAGKFHDYPFVEKQLSDNQLHNYSVFMSKYSKMIKDNDSAKITMADLSHELLDFLFEHYHDDSFSKQEIILFKILAKELLENRR